MWAVRTKARFGRVTVLGCPMLAIVPVKVMGGGTKAIPAAISSEAEGPAGGGPPPWEPCWCPPLCPPP